MEKLWVNKVHSTIIFPSFRVSDFAVHSRAQNLNKAQTKRENIKGVQYFSMYQQGVVSSTSYFIIYHLSSLYLHHHFAANFSFSPRHRHQQSTTPFKLGWDYDFVQPLLHPTADKSNPTIMTPPAAANLSAQLPRLHRCNRCLKPTVSVTPSSASSGRNCCTTSSSF